MPYHIYSKIRIPDHLGSAYLGDPKTAIMPPKCCIDRADYRRSIAESEGGRFTVFGYIVPTKLRRAYHAT